MRRMRPIDGSLVLLEEIVLLFTLGVVIAVLGGLRIVFCFKAVTQSFTGFIKPLNLLYASSDGIHIIAKFVRHFWKLLAQIAWNEAKQYPRPVV